MRGLGGIYKRGPVYWVLYHHGGREYRETSRSRERSDAVALLRERPAGLNRGKLLASAEQRVTFNALAADMFDRYNIVSDGDERKVKQVVAGTCSPTPSNSRRRVAGSTFGPA